MLQREPRRVLQEALGHQALQLLRGVLRGLGGVLGVLDLARGARVLGQHDGGQARHLVGDQGQPPAALVDAALEGGLVGGQRLLQEGPVQGDVDHLLAQFFQRAQGHVGHGHFLQVGDVLFQVLEGVANLQREEAAQAGAVLGGRHVGLVEHLDGDRVAQVDQGRKTDQAGAALADFHQLGQLAE